MSHEHPHDHHGHDHGATGGHNDASPVVADASVRTGRSSDAPAVGLVQAVVWREAYAGVVPAEILDQFEGPAFASSWRRSLDTPPAGVYRLLVACAGSQVVGFAAVGPSQDPDADDAAGELLALGVHPDARRVGHGSRLVNAAMDTLGSAGATSAATWVLTTDEATRAFLHAAGFGPDGAHRSRVVGPDARTAVEVRLTVTLGEEDATGGGDATGTTAGRDPAP